MATESRTTYASPLGPLVLCGGPGGLTALHFPGPDAPAVTDADGPAALAEPVAQLEAYFAGRRRRFELELELAGTPFQRAVWARLLEIPYGTTVSYTELARSLGGAGHVRAVAAAVGRTPVPIVVPCHRVLGADGALTGYRGGLERKRALLDLESG